MNYVPSDTGVPTPPPPTQSAEIERLHAEVQHWKDHAEEAGAGFARVCKDYARVSARNVLLVEGIQAAADAADRDLQHNTAALSRRLRKLVAPLAKEDS